MEVSCSSQLYPNIEGTCISWEKSLKCWVLGIGVEPLYLRVNREIRVPRVRVIDAHGNQLGVMVTSDALAKAESLNLDLVEVAPTATPPVCKIIDYGKFRYQQTKKEREQKKGVQQGKLKELKVKPRTDEHDLLVKIRRAREFLQKGNKVRFVCMFRGREMAHPEFGEKVLRRICDELEDVATPEARAKFQGRSLSMVLAPGAKKKEATRAKNEDAKSGQSKI